jgi:hypothetical protein
VVATRSASDDQRVPYARWGEDFFADAVASATRLPRSSSGGLIGYHVVAPERLTFEVDLQATNLRASVLLADPSEAAR